MTQNFKLFVSHSDIAKTPHIATVDYRDRGFHYGDGCFTTLYCENNRVYLFEAHIERLVNDATRIKINIDITLLRARVVQALQPLLSANIRSLAIKIVLTRGTGGRGYEPPSRCVPHVYISLHHCAPGLAACTESAVAEHCVTLCSFPLASQPLLAGIKHINRLEQVLAKHELIARNKEISARETSAPDNIAREKIAQATIAQATIAQNQDSAIYHDLLLLDASDYLIESSAGNVFFYVDKVWRTPLLNQCGVSGVMRDAIMRFMLDNNVAVEEGRYRIQDLYRAESLFTCNAIKHITPVTEVLSDEFGKTDRQQLSNQHTRKLIMGFYPFLQKAHIDFGADR